jgi:P27 family predicted phage terminase small subunit
VARTGRPRKPPGEATGHRKHEPPVEAEVVEVVALEPRPPDYIVPPPPRTPDGGELLDSSKLLWDAYWLSPVVAALDSMNGIDRYGVEDWILLVNELAVVTDVVTRSGRMVAGSMGQPVMNPLIAYADKLRSRILEREERLGLNPRDRARLGIAVGEARLTAERLNEELNAAALGGALVDFREPTLAELRAAARDAGLPGYSKMRKAALLAALEGVS